MMAVDAFAAEPLSGLSVPPPELNSVAMEGVLPGPFEQKVELLQTASAPPPPEQTIGYDTVIDNGPSDNRVDIVILGDGYTQSQIGTEYVAHVNGMLEYLFNAGQDPYPRYAKFFNAHRINTISNESGADQEPNGILVDTALDAHYFCGGTERLICISNAKANAAKETALAGAGFNAEMQFVSVNDVKYGGSGGTYAVFAGANSSANELALHEVAHSFNDLADEYGGFPTYTGAEPSEVNVTKDLTGAKWQRWHGYDQPGIGVVGAYEGARYYNQGLYRPSSDSKMRSLGRPFDAVSREKIILDIYELVDPIDDHLDDSGTLSQVDPELWVEPVDSDVLRVQWSVDGVEVAGAVGESFSPREAGFGVGSYTVSARVYDPTDWVRQNRDELEQTINWMVEILPALEVQAVQTNGGDPSRSLVTTIEVMFNTAVDVSASSFLLTNLDTDQSVGLQVSTTQSPSGTIAALRFLPGDSVQPRVAPSLHSLADGDYQLTVIAEAVTRSSGGDPMEGDYVFGRRSNDALFRRFGDVDGDGDVDIEDYARFGLTFLRDPSSDLFNPWLDVDGDGDVDGQDRGQFFRRF